MVEITRGTTPGPKDYTYAKAAVSERAESWTTELGAWGLETGPGPVLTGLTKTMRESPSVRRKQRHMANMFAKAPGTAQGLRIQGGRIMETAIVPQSPIT